VKPQKHGFANSPLTSAKDSIHCYPQLIKPFVSFSSVPLLLTIHF